LISEDATKVLVLGSQNSSNSLRLKELASERGKPSYLIDGPQDLQIDWFAPDDVVLITAGASAPEEVVQSTITWLQEHFNATVELREVRREDVQFPLPRALRSLA
jgi:4-hydroxy-3-methylbut-2-enyl diphosphate reductase